MKKTTCLGVILALAGMLLSCLDSEYRDKPGILTLSVVLTPNSNKVLGKAASTDTIFSLDSLKIVLTAQNEASQTYSYPISGRPDTGAITFSAKNYSLSSLKTWQAKILTLDSTLNRIDTVHLDSVSFNVNTGDTTFVNKSMNAIVTLLRTHVLSNKPDSINTGVRYVRLRVDGAVHDSILLGCGLNQTHFISPTKGWGAGPYGTILSTTNSGTNWFRQSSGTNRNLNDIYVLSSNNNTGWAVGDSGTILKTLNGTTWAPQSSGTTQKLNSISVQSASVVWVSGNAGTILYTSDGGTTWLTRTSGTTKNLRSIVSTAATVAWAVGDSGTILKTTNGTNWSTKTSTTSNDLYAIFMLTSLNGWAVGKGGVLIKTIDSATWKQKSSGTQRTIQSIWMQNSTTGYAVGDSGTILKTTDSSTWSQVTSNTTRNLTSIQYVDANRNTNCNGNDIAFVVGNNAPMVIGTGFCIQTWATQDMGTRTFDALLTYKYLKPNTPHTVIVQAIDTLSGTSRGYDTTLTVNVNPGKDSTLTIALKKCGYSGFRACAF